MSPSESRRSVCTRGHSGYYERDARTWDTPFREAPIPEDVKISLAVRLKQPRSDTVIGGIEDDNEGDNEGDNGSGSGSDSGSNGTEPEDDQPTTTAAADDEMEDVNRFEPLYSPDESPATEQPADFPVNSDKLEAWYDNNDWLESDGVAEDDPRVKRGNYTSHALVLCVDRGDGSPAGNVASELHEQFLDAWQGRGRSERLITKIFYNVPLVSGAIVQAKGDHGDVESCRLDWGSVKQPHVIQALHMAGEIMEEFRGVLSDRRVIVTASNWPELPVDLPLAIRVLEEQGILVRIIFVPHTLEHEAPLLYFDSARALLGWNFLRVRVLPPDLNAYCWPHAIGCILFGSQPCQLMQDEIAASIYSFVKQKRRDRSDLAIENAGGHQLIESGNNKRRKMA
ncbi:hypothetical protein B0T26DRAFT_749412 [Lasiosphaeria miniovina]|uniref:Uncharacterized protein n=1 Tax=Lasiosphaeria miniovina TaxID=1954250 RepID=A0AA40ATY8_9PEZI|nr:uncharacterized protein B0T26DRAFT_749412 [Lasiosphaeria miniovina]KAK0721944.1 hypothetical protein B0T26DRAFT_749412 [Lasiosphaeria miniovina]